MQDQEKEPEKGHGRGTVKHHHHQDFWRDWREEQRHHHHGGHHGEAPQSPEEAEAWREFFHKLMGDWPEDHWIFGGRRFSPWHQGMHSFNPFVANLLSKGGGLLPLYVLHLVSQKPLYGNEIMDSLAERTQGQWISNPGAIYPLLTQLESEGFIEGRWEDPEKRTIRVYNTTAAGQQELDRVKAIVTPKIAETIRILQEFLREFESEPESASAAESD